MILIQGVSPFLQVDGVQTMSARFFDLNLRVMKVLPGIRDQTSMVAEQRMG
ncbi:hypothetical protein [Paenibacillus glucanolyticus]|uniref:hypothetical protein n=1 Tax=Paenibacillus glucanolyticus TaxID=59843 RepID=UPI0015C37476|nr:hypothetical protein [Paenibacillus glucanolyticus]